MGILMETALAKAQAEADRQSAREAVNEELKKQSLENYNIMQSMREAHEKKLNEFYKYKDFVKKFILTEFMHRLFIESTKNISHTSRARSKALIEAYIMENGIDKIYTTMKHSNTLFLTDAHKKFMTFYENETNNAVPDDEMTYTISRDNVSKVLSDIFETEDVEEITNTIRMRVANAEEEFIVKNQTDKANIDSIIANTRQRVEDAKSQTDNEYLDSEEVATEEATIAKRKISDINSYGSKNIFHKMVTNFSEAVIKDPELRTEYSESNGRLDMVSIVETVRDMYTMLEMLSTTKLENVDDQYIRETLDSIK